MRRGTWEVVGTVSVGRTYQYRETGGLYRVLGFVVDPHSRQEKVLYVGIDGPDDGLEYAVTAWDFVQRFAPLPNGNGHATPVAPPPEPAPPAKVAGYVSTGSGV